jgi:hypothetical protein
LHQKWALTTIVPNQELVEQIETIPGMGTDREKMAEFDPGADEAQLS